MAEVKELAERIEKTSKSIDAALQELLDRLKNAERADDGPE